MDKKDVFFVVGVDFSEGSERLIKVAEEFAKDLEANLVYVHAAEPGTAYVPVDVDVVVPAPVSVRLANEEMAIWRKRCEEIAKQSRDKGLKAEAVVEVGEAAEVILEQAKLRKARLIVMGSHGHGALYHLFGGNVVTNVLRMSHVPVIVVPTRKLAESDGNS
ncbi:MAG: universal stress protein [Chthoniobacterales bacterium]|nr:universal stress protein [Chthoniobacterales bacterium]